MRIVEMKKNPRNEALYYIIREKLEGWGPLYNLLQNLVECEQMGANHLLLIEKNRGEGFVLKLRYPLDDEESLAVLTINRIALALEEDEWSKLAEKTKGCGEVEILKQAGIVMIECLEPHISLDEALHEIRKWEDVIVECYYEPHTTE